MRKFTKRHITTLLLAASIMTWALPADAQYYAKTAYDYYPGYTNYVSVPTYVNPYYTSYDYDDDYYYAPRRSHVGPVVRGAAAGSLIGLGVSFLEPRHRRHYGRNIGVGAGIGAGVGLLQSIFGY